MSVSENSSSPQIECKNLKDNSLILEMYDASKDSLIEIGMHKLMLDDLIIDQFEVVGMV